jgi:esterase/lipase superfamily enzyme
VVVNAFTELYAETEFSDDATELSHVILTAPDVSHARFGTQFRAEIQALADHLTVYVSSNDQALLMSRILNRERRLGESTLDPGEVDPLNPDQVREAAMTLDMLEPDSDLVTLVDITPVNRTRNFHNFSLETPEYFDELFLRLNNLESPKGRAMYRIRQQSGTEYWILTRGR